MNQGGLGTYTDQKNKHFYRQITENIPPLASLNSPYTLKEIKTSILQSQQLKCSENIRPIHLLKFSSYLILYAM